MRRLRENLQKPLPLQDSPGTESGWGKINVTDVPEEGFCLQCPPCMLGGTESYAKSERTSSQGAVGLS